MKVTSKEQAIRLIKQGDKEAIAMTVIDNNRSGVHNALDAIAKREGGNLDEGLTEVELLNILKSLPIKTFWQVIDNVEVRRDRQNWTVEVVKDL